MKTEFPLISFVMPVFGDQDTVEAAVDSILDQDYKNVEVILSVDGCKESEKAVKKIVEKYKSNARRVEALYSKVNRGACVARNEGAKLAKGKYLSFLPADATLLPGIARIWVTTLEENPDYDFVYSGYRFRDQKVPESEVRELAKANKLSLEEYVRLAKIKKNDDGTYLGHKGFDYLSQPFDPYFLDTTNYIDGSFPLKAETFWKVGGWDKNIKSLQDWDLWLSVVKQGGKGVFMRDIHFETDLPHKGGLSHDSASHWLERTSQIKKKHGIPERKICVASIGAPFHGKRIARMLEADYSDMPSFKPHKYEMVYLIGFYPSFADLCGQVFANCRGKRVVHWIGSDIWQMQQMDLAHRNVIINFLKNNVDYHLCEADFTQKELKELGINAKVVPLPPLWFPKVTPLPKEFTVAVYQPMQNKGFYLPEICEKVAELAPEIKFKFFGDNVALGKKRNIDYVGHVEKMEDFIGDCSALLRLTAHDGLPISVLEFLTGGRNVLLNLPVKHTQQIKSADPKVIADELRKMAKLPLNETGAKYWRKAASHEKFKETLEDLCQYKPEEYWDNRAELWDEAANKNYSLPDEDLKVIKKWLKDIEYKSVLDLGMGNGRFVPLFEGKKYLGVDISKKLTKIAETRYPDKEFKTMKVEDISRLKGKFDLIFSYTTLEHIKPEDWDKAVKSVKSRGKWLLLIEPTGFESMNYCIDHDYENSFDVVKKKKLSDKTMYLCKL